MCIAIIKPGSAPLPTLEQLENCAKTNRDGGGLCYPTNDGRIQIMKGFNTAQAMFDFLQTQDFAQVPMMIHWRIGTHGDKSSPNHTHPFPVGASQEEMEKCNLVTDMALMHNGIMYKFGYDKEISDTMAFARDALPHILKMPVECRGIVLSEVLGTANKIALMDSEGEISKVGTWIEDGGLFWSNTSYKTYTYQADPRNWGSCAGYIQGGKYKKKSSAQTSVKAGYEDIETSFAWKKPVGAQFWSEVIEADAFDYDTEALKDDYFDVIKVLGRQIPHGLEKPAQLTNKEWDSVLSYRYAFNFIKDAEWEQYLEVRVLPGELEVEMAVTKSIEEAAQPTLPLEHDFVNAD